MKTLIVIALIACIAPNTNATTPKIVKKSMTILCGFDVNKLRNSAFKRYGESTSLIDVVELGDGTESIIEVTTNPRTRTSTIFTYKQDGKACIIGLGSAYKLGKSKEDDL